MPQSISVQRILDRDTLDPYLVRTEILDAVVDLAHQLRERHQVAQGITLGVSCSGGSSVSRSPDPGRAERIPRRPTGHGDGSGSNLSDWSGPRCALHPALRACALGGLQRSHGHACRIRSVSRGHPPG
ncbi:hypothetical protein [Actinacidiphila glaucinigra]|uniref:DinB/UmuC family translesion DNA polymerase n=1 Tax=Actinacidiphila glaucinigra TaxID=235986 RepID=UPI0037F72C7C